MSADKSVTLEQYIRLEFGIDPPACKMEFLNHLLMLRTFSEMAYSKEDKKFYDNAADVLQDAFLKLRAKE